MALLRVSTIKCKSYHAVHVGAGILRITAFESWPGAIGVELTVSDLQGCGRTREPDLFTSNVKSLGNLFSHKKVFYEKILKVLSIAGLAMVSSASFAADKDKPVAFWLCSDFLTVNETFQPTALGFAAAVNHQGNIQEAVLDVDGIAKLHPQVVKHCKENPQIALRDALIQTGVKTSK